MNMIGKTISHYKILEHLGSGGMGVVYKAQDLKLDRFVALKFLPHQVGQDTQERQRFIREAKAASALDHPNICTIYEIDETGDSQMFIAMAYSGGETLKKKIERGPLSIADAIEIARQIARGLARVHEAGITHGDIKPANILITNRDEVKIVDFGLARLAGRSRITKPGAAMGTVSYMSPEQLHGEGLDHRTDIWSLGVVIYEMLTGREPFQRDYDQAVAYLIVNQDPEPVTALRPEVPEALGQVVEKLLRKDPGQRYQQAEEMLTDLQRLRPSHVVEKHTGKTPVLARLRKRRAWVNGSLAMFVLLLFFISIRFMTSGHRENIRSIAVLPMSNRSGDSAQEYIVDGMTDLLINHLSRLSGLDRVISRTTMMRYKHSDQSLREIGQELKADALIEASVLSDGEQLLVTVNLIEAETERNLWGRTYERAFRDLLRVEREIALAIAREIELQLTPQDQRRLVKTPEADPEALELYLKGLQTRSKDWMDHQQAIGYFVQAIAIDSGFAPAHAGLAIQYALQGGFDILPGGEAKARQFADKALSLDPSLSEPYIAIGLVRELIDWDWTGAEEAFRRAIELNPGNAFAYHELGQLLMRLGRFQEALAMSKRALYLSPLSARYQFGVGAVYLYSGRYDQAIAEFKRALELDPSTGTMYLSAAYWQTGMYEEALKLWEADGKSEAGRVKYYALTGEREKALAVLEHWKKRWALGDVDLDLLSNLASIYADLGDKEQALDWLERAYRMHSGGLVWVKVDPDFYSLHDQPRFQALLEKMGFPE